MRFPRNCPGIGRCRAQRLECFGRFGPVVCGWLGAARDVPSGGAACLFAGFGAAGPPAVVFDAAGVGARAAAGAGSCWLAWGARWLGVAAGHGGRVAAALGGGAHLGGVSDALGLDGLSGVERLWSLGELAAFLGVSVSTVHDWRGRGLGPAAYRVGKHLRFAPAEVGAWLGGLREAEPGAPAGLGGPGGAPGAGRAETCRPLAGSPAGAGGVGGFGAVGLPGMVGGGGR
jgi:predicted DNA-binding transcriptional regulator AlpA